MREGIVAIVLVSGVLLLLVACVLAVRRGSHGLLATLCLQPMFHRSTGAYLVATRRDLRVRGALVLAAAAVMLVVTVVASRASAYFAPRSTAELSLIIYASMAGLLSVLFALSGLGDLASSIWRRPTIIRRPPSEVVADLEQLLSTEGVQEIPPDEWPDFAAIRYAHPGLESFRRKLADNFPFGHPPILPEDATQLRELAAELAAITA